MPNYKEMYFNLAGKVADAIDLLVQAQQEGEDQYIMGNRSPIDLRLTNEETEDEEDNVPPQKLKPLRP